MNKLILTIGLPRSGKTTWARKQNIPIVNPDSIRLALHGERFIGLAEGFVWAVAYLMADALFLAGHPAVIIDATNNTPKRRLEWVNKFKNARIEYVYFNTPKEVCIERSRALNDLYILPVIERMANESDFSDIDQLSAFKVVGDG